MKNILIVDDEPDVGMIFSKIVAEQGFLVRHCASVEEAVPVMQKEGPFSLLFLDIRLPGMDGLNAIPKFLEIDRSIPIVMMTAYQTVESVIAAMREGAIDFLVKPLDSPIILQAIQKYGRKQKSLSTREPIFEVKRESPVFIVGSENMRQILSVAEKFASVDGPILLLGESGTGKELLAHYIHQKSSRSRGPLGIVDCTSIPESLFESELFGYEKGAFTGAESSKAGRFETAEGGTLFLDEIGNVPLTMQAKLLRFMEEHTISRLGGNKTFSLNIRLITATNADLQKLVGKGEFREDLYYRLSTLTLHLPPLRNRSKEEKESLISHILERNSKEIKRPLPVISESARNLLLEYPWPGNVRELENALYSAALLTETRTIEVTDLPIGIQSYFSHKEQVSIQPDVERKSMREILKKVEKDQILTVLKQTKGNKKKASEILDMDYKTFLTKLKEYGNFT